MVKPVNNFLIKDMVKHNKVNYTTLHSSLSKAENDFKKLITLIKGHREDINPNTKNPQSFITGDELRQLAIKTLAMRGIINAVEKETERYLCVDCVGNSDLLNYNIKDILEHSISLSKYIEQFSDKISLLSQKENFSLQSSIYSTSEEVKNFYKKLRSGFAKARK